MRQDNHCFRPVPKDPVTIPEQIRRNNPGSWAFVFDRRVTAARDRSRNFRGHARRIQAKTRFQTTTWGLNMTTEGDKCALTSIRGLLLAGLSALVLTACGGSSSDPADDIRDFIVSLSGDNQVPEPVGGDASGSATVTVNFDTGEVSGTITTSGLTGDIQQAHIHDGFAGTNGGVLVALEVDAGGDSASFPGGSSLTADERTALLEGRLYLNVHTTANPNGEIRGQIIPAGIVLVRSEISGDQHVPEPIDSSISGVGYATITRTSTASTSRTSR